VPQRRASSGGRREAQSVRWRRLARGLGRRQTRAERQERP